MPPPIEDHPPSSIPSHLLALLTTHLPYSLPLLRRLQFASRINRAPPTPDAHILFVPGERHFAAAYADLSRGPETECWVYSTLQDSVPRNEDPTSAEALSAALGDDELALCVEQLRVILRRVRRLEMAYAEAHLPVGEEVFDKGHLEGHVRVGAVHETVRRLLVEAGVGIRATSVVPVGKEWEFYATWLFRGRELRVHVGRELPEGMRWDVVRREDTGLVRGRTNIPRQEDTLLMLPSTAIRLGDGTTIAWGFLGLDGSVSTVHVEEPYRGRGLAKALTGRLVRDHLQDFGHDGWGSTDISTSNQQSQGLFRSLGGRPAWTISWMYLDLTSVGEAL